MNAHRSPVASVAIAESVALDAKRGRLTSAWMVLIAFACFAVAGLIATTAIGQEAAEAPAAKEPYKFNKIDPRFGSERAIKMMKAETRTYASTGDAKMQYVTAYFTRYVYPTMTSRDGNRHISEIVSDINSFISRAAKSNRAAVHQTLTTQTARVMKPIAEGNYHPSARIAAVTLLGQLDGKLADIANKQPAQPLSAVLPILIALYEDENNDEGVRAAALHGIARHAEYGFKRMPANLKTQIIGLMTNLLGSEPPAGRSPQAHAYLQRYAVDSLYYLQPEGDAAFGDMLVNISTNDDSADLIALHTVARLGSMPKSMEGKVKSPETVLAKWAKRTAKAFEAELARFAAMEKRTPVRGQPRDPKTFLRSTAEAATPTPMMGGPDGDMFGGGPSAEMMNQMMMGGQDQMDMEAMMGAMGPMGPMGFGGMAAVKEQPPEVIMSRRKLNHVLQQVHRGVTGVGKPEIPTKPGGLMAAAGADNEEDVKAWLTQIHEVIDEINDETYDTEAKYLKAVEKQLEVLSEMAGEGGDANGDAVLGADGLGADPLGADPLGADGLGADPLGADPLSADPLGN
ncbi:hypothetical protein Pla22_30990 [Rubripirellula amarantea]|uniref:Uncharacterized protein n=1 Tax=Rubripirellula amarantea TaxID=2527999 RepID=A0A5C5WIF6_9BACT|nr:hypothetical protein [Rubripirellula amarantea]TWT50357.1 hypothetical protein Pla22_30990 [Rubripirellula amarantea]